MLDGEIVVAQNGALDFDSLQLRIHPAASRIKLLSEQIPASIVFFDLLSEGKKDLRGEPFEERRRKLESPPSAKPPLHLTPATSDFDKASDWFRAVRRRGLDGVVAIWTVENLRIQQARDVEGQTSAIVIALSPAFAGTRKATAIGRIVIAGTV